MGFLLIDTELLLARYVMVSTNCLSGWLWREVVSQQWIKMFKGEEKLVLIALVVMV